MPGLHDNKFVYNKEEPYITIFIAPDKRGINRIFFFFLHKSYIYQGASNEYQWVSEQINICFWGEIKKNTSTF